MGLLGFRKEVAALEGLVREREEEVGRLVAQRREVRRRIEGGRRLVEFEERVRACEEGVAVGEGEGSEESESEEDEDEEEGEGQFGTSVARLRRNVVQYRLAKEVVKGLEEHPFVVAQAHRLNKVRSTILLDLSTALQQAKKAGDVGAGRVMQIMKTYADMEETGEAIKVLKTLKK